MVDDDLSGIDEQTKDSMGTVDAAAADLSLTWKAAMDEIVRLRADRPWGGDFAGNIFGRGYLTRDDLNELFTVGVELIDGPDGVSQLAKDARAAIENSLASDEEQEKILKKPIKGS